MNSRASGFTLIELLVVISIIGFVLSIVSRNNSVVLERSRDAALMTEVSHLRNAIHQYVLEHEGTFPPDLNAVQKYFNRPLTGWKGAKASGQFSYDSETGILSLYNSKGSGKEFMKDSKGIPYAEY